jgi:hypothetical protein
MIEIEVQDGMYVVRAPQLLLVLTKAQFMAALQRGNAYRRREALNKR